MKPRMYLFILFIVLPLNLLAQGQIPQWAKGAVWYQIFPERFRNASSANDPVKERVVGDRFEDWQVHPWASNWYKLQTWEQARDQKFYDLIWDRRYGGDLVGVIEKLNYLKLLGVDVIYLNPVFEAPSLHKYDASTYHHIDNNFGNDRENDWQVMQIEKDDPSTWTFSDADKVFLDLIKKAHELNIKVVIDGVFNHCGTEFWAFQDIVKNQQKSPYKDWFDVISWDDPATPDSNEFDYKGWWGYKGLPEFKEDENGLVEPVKQYVFNITRRWMDPNGDGDSSDGIDGWRLDVANEVNAKFWQKWYQLVKSINPQAITVAELWQEAPERIKDKQFDTTMNYPFAYAVVDFFIDDSTKISVSEFDQALAHLRKIYPEEINHILMNLLDSHDTDRIASMIKNPDRNYNREASIRHNPNYDPRKPTMQDRKIHKLIAIFQMMYLGAPMIYYGDEAGMWGGTDPDERMPMVWPEMTYENLTYNLVQPGNKDADSVEFDRHLFEFYKKLVQIRHENPAITQGDFKTQLLDDKRGIYAFARTYKKNEIWVVLNNGETREEVEIASVWENDTKVEDILNGKSYHAKNQKLKISIESKSGAILARRDK